MALINNQFAVGARKSEGNKVYPRVAMTIPGIPIIENDPFLKYRPFPENPDNLFLQHWHEVVGAVIFYFGIQLILPIILTWLFGKAYTDLKRRTKVNFDIHIVLMVQCTLLVVLLLPTWNHPNWQNREANPIDLLYGFTEYLGFVSAVTVGYFVWDFIVCLLHFDIFGVGFLFHAFAALWVFSVSFYPYCTPWIPAFLLFELSTPFVNINWFATRLPDGAIPDWLVLTNGILLLFTFFFVRIIWGFYSVALLAYDMWRIRHISPWYLPIPNLALNFCLDCLNVFWFSKMLAIAKKRLTGKTKKLE